VSCFLTHSVFYYLSVYYLILLFVFFIILSFILLFIIYYLLLLGGGSCDSSWSLHDDNCYQYYNDKETQYDARAECHSHDAELVSINNQFEMDFVRSLM